SLPLLLQGVPLAESDARARQLLELVGLTNRATHFVHQLSGGEQQRTAIARALVHRPSLLIADEPTGNLDTASAERVLELFRQVARERLTTLVLVTHSAEVAESASRVVEMRDGKIASDRSLMWEGPMRPEEQRRANGPGHKAPPTLLLLNRLIIRPQLERIFDYR